MDNTTDRLSCHTQTFGCTAGELLRINLNLKVQHAACQAYLDPGAGVQHDVLNGALNVLRPRHQPSHFVVMTNLFPLGAWRRLGVFGVPVRNTLTKTFNCYTP